MQNNSKLISDTELTVVIDPSCHTHMMNYEMLADFTRQKKYFAFKDYALQQAYFENPSNKCILIRGIKDEYKRTEDNKITLECEQGKYGALTCSYTNHYDDNKKAVYAHKYEEIEQIIQSQIKTLKINTNNIEKITIFDISHTDKETKKFSAGFIQEKVDTLKVLNLLCPNCKHTKIASTACWGATKDVNGKDLIDEILTSINKNKDWKKQNIVEIDITPENDNNTLIKIANDNKPHIYYELDKDMYEDAQLQLPTNFTRTIYLLTKNKQPKIIKQTHNFQKSTSTKNPYRVKEGEGGFYALSIEDITKYLDTKLEKKEFQTIQEELKREVIIKNQDAISATPPTIQETKNDNDIQKHTKQLENINQPQKRLRKKNYLKPICIGNNNKKKQSTNFQKQPCKNNLQPLKNVTYNKKIIISNKNNNMQQLQKLSRNNDVKQIIPNKIYQPMRPIIRPTIQHNSFLQPRQLIISHKNYLNPIQQQPRYYLQKKPIINKNNNMQQLQKLSRNNYEEKGEIVGSFKF